MQGLTESNLTHRRLPRKPPRRRRRLHERSEGRRRRRDIPYRAQDYISGETIFSELFFGWKGGLSSSPYPMMRARAGEQAISERKSPESYTRCTSSYGKHETERNKERERERERERSLRSMTVMFPHSTHLLCFDFDFDFDFDLDVIFTLHASGPPSHEKSPKGGQGRSRKVSSLRSQVSSSKSEDEGEDMWLRSQLE
jgi:hypothetical protein